MRNIDYMKVADLVSKTFGADKNLQSEGMHDKLDKIDKINFVMTLPSGIDIPFRFFLYANSIDMVIEKKYFETVKFEKWLSSFEFELEQQMLKNIKVNVSRDHREYKIRISI